METSDFVISRKASLQHQLFAAWCAPIFSVLTVIGFFGIAHFYAPAHADLSPAAAHAWFSDHRSGVELGMSIWIIAACFLGAWTAQLGVMLAKMERGSPVMAIGQIIAGAGIVVIVIIDASLWMGAAYRVDASGQIMQALSDAAWLSLLIAWPILSLQMLCTGVVTIRDKSATAIFPQWLSKASIAGAFLLFTAGGPAFAMSGVFSYHGALGYYVPFAIWGAWLDTHAWFMRKEIRRQQAASDDGAGTGDVDVAEPVVTRAAPYGPAGARDVVAAK
jgi:hypothetical protein